MLENIISSRMFGLNVLFLLAMVIFQVKIYRSDTIFNLNHKELYAKKYNIDVTWNFN